MRSFALATPSPICTKRLTGGRFVQWDWLASADTPDFGFTEPDIRDAIIAAGFNAPAITLPFVITRGDHGPMPVLMAMASAQFQAVYLSSPRRRATALNGTSAKPRARTSGNHSSSASIVASLGWPMAIA